MSFWFDPMVQTVGMPNIPGPAAGPDPFSAKISAQQINQQNQLAGWNQTNQNIMNNLATQGPGSDYGKVHLPYLTGSFGPAAAAGTYSPGSGRSSFSGTPLGTSKPATGGSSVFDIGAPGYNSYGGAADIDWMLGGSQGPRPSETYNAPRTYGWDANEGAPAPAAPQVYNRGEFNPHTYGWDHNEGSPLLGGKEDQAWVQGGSQGARPSSGFEYGGKEDIDWYEGGSQGERPSTREPTYPIGSDAVAVPAAVPQLPRQIPSPVDHPYPLGTPDWYNDMRPGGSADQSWVQGGSQGSRPSSGEAGRAADQAWVEGGSQGPRPSSLMDEVSARSKNEPSFLGMYDWGTSYGNRDPASTTALRDAGAASPRAYDPQLDQLSRGIPQQPSATRDQIAKAIADRFSQVGGASPNTFGAPSSGYLGVQNDVMRDPFSAYVNPQSLDAGGSFPGNYTPGNDARPFQYGDSYQNPFGPNSFSGG